ncbi:MAG: NUDIX hydrolase, partial [Haliea sp.]
MEKKQNRAQLAFERPLTTVDVVIFAVSEGTLKLLLVRRPEDSGDASEPYPGRWALPGGFVDVDRDASLQACAARKLQEKTGVEAPYLEQLGSWGDALRD